MKGLIELCGFRAGGCCTFFPRNGNVLRERRDLKRGSRVVGDVNDGAWDGCASWFFMCQHGFVVCGEIPARKHGGIFLSIFSRVRGTYCEVGRWRVRYCTAGIGTKLLFYSNCDILGEGDRGGIRGLGKVCFCFCFSRRI